MTFAEIICVRSERGLTASMSEAARRDRTTMAEWMRRKLHQALVAEGLELGSTRDHLRFGSFTHAYLPYVEYSW
jgi:hypothetical protein